MTEDLAYPQVGTSCPAVEQRLDLEAVTVPGTAPQRGCLALGTLCAQLNETEVIERVLPERGVAVAEIAPRLAIANVREESKGTIPDPPHRGQVLRATACDCSGPLHKVGPRAESINIEQDLDRVHRPVGVQHHDHVAFSGEQAGRNCVPFSRVAVLDHLGRGAHRPDDRGCAVLGPPVDNDDLFDAVRQAAQHPGDVLALVFRGDDNRDRRIRRSQSALSRARARDTGPAVRSWRLESLPVRSQQCHYRLSASDSRPSAVTVTTGLPSTHTRKGRPLTGSR